MYNKKSAKFDVYTYMHTCILYESVYALTFPVVIIMANQTYDSHKFLQLTYVLTNKKVPCIVCAIAKSDSYIVATQCS